MANSKRLRLLILSVIVVLLVEACATTYDATLSHDKDGNYSGKISIPAK